MPPEASATTDVGVTAVIPSIGRPEVRRAVQSVLDQSEPVTEVIVSWDLLEGDPRAGAHAAWLDGRGVAQVFTGGGRGPSAARMLAVGRVRTALVGFLDDDDVWEHGKLAAQVGRYRALCSRTRFPVVSTLITRVDEADRELVRHGITAQPAPGRVDRALFRRAWSRRREPLVIGPPALVVPTELLHLEPFDADRHLHEDWEWLIRIDRRPDTVISVVEEHLTRVHALTAGPRASRVSGGWRESVRFAEDVGLPGDVLGDFLLCDVLPRALEDATRRECVALVRQAVTGARPSAGALRETAGRLARRAVGIAA